MNPLKRPRYNLNEGDSTVTIIDLTSDDETSILKRQKSIPPTSSALVGDVPSDSRRITPEAQNPGPSWKVEHKSPFRNQPPWLLTSTKNHSTQSTRYDNLSVNARTPNVTKPPVPGVVDRSRFESTRSNSPTKPTSSPLTLLDPAGKPDKYSNFASAFRLPPTQPLRFETNAQVSAKPAEQAPRPPLVVIPKAAHDAQNNSPTHFQRGGSASLPVRPSTSSSSSHQTNFVSLDLPTPARDGKHLFQRPPSHGARKVLVEVPLSKDKQLREQVRDELKKSAKFAELHPKELGRVLGLTGFALDMYPLDLDVQRFKRAAQPKKRKVDRSAVKLEIDRKVCELDLGHGARSKFVHPRDQVKAILTDRFGEIFDPPLTFSNNLNDARLDGKFQFVNDYILRQGVKTTGILQRPACAATCPMGQTCASNCACITRHLDDHFSKETLQVPSYRRRPDGIVVLTDQYIEKYAHRTEIFECSDACLCGSGCTNRVVQKGRTVPLEIFQTPLCGFGVRSGRDLVRGQFIESYLGEVITEEELELREEAADDLQCSYIYSLDWFAAQNTYHIDGANFGSAMRFVNHNCSPNARSFTVMNHMSTRNLYSIGFFAIQDIPAGTEITIDYQPQNAVDTSEERSSPLENEGVPEVTDGLLAMYLDGDQGLQKCHCGASNCRQRLWSGARSKRRR